MNSQACTWSITVLRDADMKPHLGGESGASVAARSELRPGSRAFLLRSVRAAAAGRSVARLPSSILAVAPVIDVGQINASHFLAAEATLGTTVQLPCVGIGSQAAVA
jgi:hypothetical protein